jgi:hypothetical protein
MQYSEVNPVFEFDIYKSRIDKSWNLFISIFRWSFAIQFSNPEIKTYQDYLDGNYSAKKEFEDKIDQFYDDPSKYVEDEEETWLKQFSDSVVGEEELDDDHDYHPLEGIYYSHFFDHFVEVKQFNEDPLFTVQHEKHPLLLFADGYKEKVMAVAIERNLKDGLWEKVISL